MSSGFHEDDFYYVDPFIATSMEEDDEIYIYDGYDSYEAEQQDAFLLQDIESALSFQRGDGSIKEIMEGMDIVYTSPLFFLETQDSLLRQLGIGRLEALFFSMVPYIARSVICEGYDTRSRLNTYPRMADYLKTLFVGIHREHFYVIMLNRQGYLQQTTLIDVGTEDSALFNLHDVISFAVHCNAKAIVFCHNHPRGTLKPSDDDIACTLCSLSIAKAMGIPLLDHIIIGNNRAYSMRESGIIPVNLWIDQSPGSKLMRGWLDHDVLEMPFCQ